MLCGVHRIDVRIGCVVLRQQLHQLAQVRGVPVICYGLRSDFRGEPFPGSAYLLALADDIEEIKNICTCGKKATMNIRVDDDGKRVFQDGDAAAVGQLPAADIDVMFDAIRELSGMSQEDVDELGKPSPGAQPGSSPSASSENSGDSLASTSSSNA